jgi:cytochrome c
MFRRIDVGLIKVVSLIAASLLSFPAAADLAASRQLTVTQCSQCHTFDKGEKHGQGPNLFGLIGRDAAAVPGFVFSPGIKEALQGKVWDRALLEKWLTDTIAVAPKAQMVYFQDDPEIRAMLIEFLESLK